MEQKLGTVQVSPAVLATLVRLTAAGVPGVARVDPPGPAPLRWLPWWRRPTGVSLQVLADGAHVEVELAVQQGSNMLEVAARVQREVGETVEKTAGVPVREVNVRIADVL